MPFWGWIVIAVGAVVVAAIVLGTRFARTKRLRDAFGAEHDSTVDETELDPEVRGAFLDRWRATQERFVDDPHGAAIEADHLVLEVMRARGYPAEDVDRRAVRQSTGDATTEDLRNAMRHYRALFDELLETDTYERLRVERG